MFDPFVFVLGFEADQIHASFSAVVSSVEPIPVGTRDGRVAGSPGEEVVVPSVVLNATIVQSCKCEFEKKMRSFLVLLLQHFVSSSQENYSRDPLRAEVRFSWFFAMLVDVRMVLEIPFQTIYGSKP